MKHWLWKTASALSLVALGMLLSFGIFAAWVELYPEDQDPKNIDYVLWTHGLNQNMNLDHAIAGMTDDRRPVRLVTGMSKEQLKKRFGYIHTLEETPNLSGCYPATGGLGRWGDGTEAAFLRNGPWMVILDKGKAVDLVLCKGY